MAGDDEGRVGDIVDCCSLAWAARPYCFDGLPRSAPTPPHARCAAGRLEEHLLLELTLWSSPRLQEPPLHQQST